MRLLTVDVGTNTILALGAEVVGERLVATGDAMDIARLGEGLDRTGELSPAAIGRALSALAKVATMAREAGADVARAIATESVRKARNAAAFLDAARATLGFPIEVIDGEREAALSWLATSRSLPGPGHGGRRTVLDIGGGSTELIVGDASEDDADRAVSVPIGSVRLTERLLHGDPPTHAELAALDETIARALEAAPALDGDLVGVAGTVTTICAVHLGLDAYDASAVHGRRMARAEVDATLARLTSMTHDERRAVRGLDPRRADVIVAGGAILLGVMRKAGVESLTVSDRGIRWGLAYELAEQAVGRRLA